MSLQDQIGSLQGAIDDLKDRIDDIKSSMAEWGQINDVEQRLRRIENKLQELIDAREDA